MKMPRSQCESENIQFVQELAEVDGPFESPININFRDLTKLELPSLVWNRGDTFPKKMKITNTGHTVLVRYPQSRNRRIGNIRDGRTATVFSPIKETRGPVILNGNTYSHKFTFTGVKMTVEVANIKFAVMEMHVAHFKTEYLTQESALREKDGMVVVVYLFKLQEEPNQSLKKIINLLPCVKQPSTSHAVDPRPILSFCKPFTDDYFMYWGSVVTSTCAHILLWIICREPFGISREQVNEFRKIMDSCQQPICRNNRDIQPLHRRNVFHVNASKHLEDPLLPIKNILGCYCKESRENVNAQQSQDCKCQAPLQNQEEVEGSTVEYTCGNHCTYTGGVKPLQLDANQPSGCFTNQTIFVQRATVHSVSVLLKRFGSEPVENNHHTENSRQHKPDKKYQSKLASKSCCFFPLSECSNIRIDKRKPRGKRPFNSIKGFSQVIHSLEVLKNQTFKKLKEIESINQEIKGMKSFCHNNEDKRWLQKIEKMMKRQKRLTIKSSQGCFSELKKLARDCNFDKLFDCKALPVSENGGKLMWLYNDEVTKENITIPNSTKVTPMKETSKRLNVGKAVKFSTKAQKLIQSFFEDIQDSDELNETVKKDLNLKKIKTICSKQARDLNSVSSVIKGYITQNMFVLGNLGDRFFMEVTTEDFENDKHQWKNTNETEKLLHLQEIIRAEEISDYYKNEKSNNEKNQNESSENKNEELIPLHRASIAIVLSETSAGPNETLVYEDLCYDLNGGKKSISDVEILSDTETSQEQKRQISKKQPEKLHPKLAHATDKECHESAISRLMKASGESNVHRSSSNLSTGSAETQRMIIAKFRRRYSRKDSGEENSSVPGRKSYMSLYRKNSCKEFEGYYMRKKNQKTKRKKKQKGDKIKHKSSSSREESSVKISKSNWKSLTKAKFKLEIERTSNTFLDLAFENSLLTPKRKELKFGSQEGSARTSREHSQIYSTDAETRSDDRKIDQALEKKDNSTKNEHDENLKEKQQRVTPKSGGLHTDMGGTSLGKTLRASSVDAKTSHREKTGTIGEYNLTFQTGNETVTGQIPKYMEIKSVYKSRSLTTVTITPRISTEITQRLYLESLDGRRKNNKEAMELRKLESPKKLEGKSQIKNDPIHGILKGNEESDEEQQTCTNHTPESKEKREAKSPNKLEYNTGFFTTDSSRVDKELLVEGRAQEVKARNTVLKRCDREKYRFLEKGLKEQSPSFQDRNEENSEILHQTDSRKSFTNDPSKGFADPTNIGTKDLQTSVSYRTLKENSPSRPHSAETLNSHRKSFKRKSKKRPHCCKRISRHYIRKNSSIFKKPNKTESKPLNFLSLPDQEQLKIISVNVAKYLKQKLIEESYGVHPEKNRSIKDIEEAVFTKLKATQEKKELTPPKEVGTVQDLRKLSTKDSEKIKQNRIPIAKAKEKKKEKLTHPEGKIKTKSIKTTNEPKNEKPVRTLPKPVNNFIKLNKQMAGKYKKRSTPSPEKNQNVVEQKENLKSPPEATRKTETQKFKTKIPKKRLDKNPAQKGPPEQSKTSSDTPASLKTQKLSPTRNSNKEDNIKSPVASKKIGSKNKKLPTGINAEESKELVVCEKNPKETPASNALQKISPEKIVPAHVLTYLPSPTEILENQKKPTMSLRDLGNTISDNYSSEVLYNNKENILNGNATIFKKELDYFIKLEMHLNDMSTNIEHSMNYVKSTLDEDCYGSNLIKHTPASDQLCLDPSSKEIVLLKMKDEECSSSDSDFVEELEKYSLTRDVKTNQNNDFDKCKEISIVKIPKESGDHGTLTPTLVRTERQEEANSDSSYDCKISITLNTNFNMEGEPVQRAAEEKPLKWEKRDGEMPGYDPPCCPPGSSHSQTQTSLEESSSQSIVVKQHRRKRKDNEISLEMKHKLLEILEGEIRREVGIKCGGSSENSSDGLTFKWDDSDGNSRSQSTESSCDNIEILTQISDTMKQYLKNLKEKGQLVERITESSDKESK